MLNNPQLDVGGSTHYSTQLAGHHHCANQIPFEGTYWFTQLLIRYSSQPHEFKHTCPKIELAFDLSKTFNYQTSQMEYRESTYFGIQS